jgi:hypothetical protein
MGRGRSRESRRVQGPASGTGYLPPPALKEEEAMADSLVQNAIPSLRKVAEAAVGD